MQLTLTREHQKKAGYYTDSANCIIATALKSRFPKTKTIRVGGDELTLGRKRYTIRPALLIPRLSQDASMLPYTIELIEKKS